MNKHSGIGSLNQLLAKSSESDFIHSNSSAFRFQNIFMQYNHFGLDINSVYEFKDIIWGNVHQFPIPHQKQNMIKNIWINIKLPALNQNIANSTYVHYINNLGYNIIKNVYFKLDDQIIDSFTGHYLYVLHNLESTTSQLDTLNILTGTHNADNGINGNSQNLFIPIPLWHSKTLQQYFPLLATSQQKFVLQIEFEKLENIILSDGDITNISLQLKTASNKIFTKFNVYNINILDSNNNIIPNHFSINLLIDYILLNDIERDLFLKNEQSFMFPTHQTQVHFLKNEIEHIQLQFSFPVKQIIFILTSREHNDFNFNTFNVARLLLSDTYMDYFTSDYYSTIQDYFHNFCVNDKNIHSFNFSLNSFIGEPNGFVHFGKLKNKVLEIHGAQNNYIHIFARSINVFNTAQGFGNLKLI